MDTKQVAKINATIQNYQEEIATMNRLIEHLKNKRIQRVKVFTGDGDYGFCPTSNPATFGITNKLLILVAEGELEIKKIKLEELKQELKEIVIESQQKIEGGTKK